jgi:excisionase family DNA binding protein
MAWLNIKAAAQHTTLSKSYLHELVQHDRIPYSRVGKRIVFDSAQLDAFLAGQAVVAVSAKPRRVA